MYKRGDSDWVSIDPYCFIKPIIKEEEDSKGFNLLSSESSFKGRLDKVGIVAYPSKELTSQGVKKGDKVRFSKNSEYEFEVEGELYYKMSTKDVLAVI
jgi:co-chaperonin GroES (HSP10)